jgi:hypothetical protein
MATLLVTVIAPTSDATVYLTRAVASVLGQSYWNIAHIIVARDHLDYEAQLRQAGVNDPRVRIIATKRPGEFAASAFNTGVAEARGSIIAPLMPMDLFYANRLDSLVSLVQTFGVATDNRRIVSESSRCDLGTVLPLDGQMRTLEHRLFSHIMMPVSLVAHRHHFEPDWNTKVGDMYQLVTNLRIVGACKRIPIVPQPLHELRLAATGNSTLFQQLTTHASSPEPERVLAEALVHLDTTPKRMLALHTRRQAMLRQEFETSHITDAIRFLGEKRLFAPSGVQPTPYRPAPSHAA